MPDPYHDTDNITYLSNTNTSGKGNNSKGNSDFDEKEKRAYQFVQNLLQKTQDQLLQGTAVASNQASQNSSGNASSLIPLDQEINLNLKTLTNYQLKLQLKAEEAI